MATKDKIVNLEDLKVSHDDLDGKVSDLKSDFSSLMDEVYTETAVPVNATSTGWILNDTGLCSKNTDYQMVKYLVTDGDYLKVSTSDKFQFQNSASVPSSGETNRIGTTYGSGTHYVTVPTGATHLIVSTEVSGGTAEVYVLNSTIEKAEADIETLRNDLLGGHISYQGFTWATGKIDGSTGADGYNASTKRTVGYYPTSAVDVVAFSNNNSTIGVYYYNDDQGDYVRYNTMNGTKQTFILINHDYPYFRIAYNRNGYTELPSVDEITAYKYTDTQNDVNDLQIFVPEMYKGYIGGTSGGISAPSNTNKELYSEKIPVKEGMEVTATLSYISSSHNMWFAYATYDTDGNFIERVIIVNSQAASQSSHSLTVPSGVGFVAYTFRSYDDYHFTVQTADIVYVLAQISRESQKEWEKYFVNENVKSVNHRGYNLIAPENTIPAYKLSKLNGFKYVETDIQFTSDGVPVCIHDASINRTARNADGTTISETINIADITYEQALSYDFGVYKNASYTGTKIPTFEEFMLLCKRIGLLPYVELKAGTPEQIAALVSAAFDYGMLDRTVWISSNPTLLEYLKAADSTATIGIITSAITSNTIGYGRSLKTDDNIVFIDSSSYTAAEVAMCKAEKFPLEVWTLNDISVITTNLDDYITGVTSDYVVAGAEMYNAYIGD